MTEIVFWIYIYISIGFRYNYECEHDDANNNQHSDKSIHLIHKSFIAKERKEFDRYLRL